MSHSHVLDADLLQVISGEVAECNSSDVLFWMEEKKDLFVAACCLLTRHSVVINDE